MSIVTDQAELIEDMEKEIAALKAENAMLREALENLTKVTRMWFLGEMNNARLVVPGALIIADAALKGKE